MRLILSRHGNTFSSEETVRWIGCYNDFPLTASGEKQAQVFSSAFVKAHYSCYAIYCAPLKRTFDYARIILKNISDVSTVIPLRIDARLNELDYGAWAGLKTEEIIQRFSLEALNAWQQHSQWPKYSGWGSSEDIVSDEIGAFMQELSMYHQPNETVIIVSSNGKLRYFLKHVAHEFDQRAQNGTLAVKTGHICQLTYDEHTRWRLDYWNQAPSCVMP